MGTACPYSPTPWTPILRERQLGRLFRQRKGAGGQRTSFRSMTASAEFPVTFGWYSYRSEARLLGWWGSSPTQRDGESGSSSFFIRRGRTLAGPPYLGTSGGANPYLLFLLRSTSPLDKGSRPLPYGSQEILPGIG